MINLFEGSITLRGKAENLIRFLTEKLDGSYNDNNITLTTDDEICKKSGVENGVVVNYLIKDQRATAYLISDIDDDKPTMLFNMSPCDILDYDKSTNVITFHSMGVLKNNCEEYIKLAKEYEVDIKLYEISRSALYIKEFEILDNGNTVNDLSRQFDKKEDFLWACPVPWFGEITATTKSLP